MPFLGSTPASTRLPIRSRRELVPEEELSLIYQAKGLPEDLAKSLAERLIANLAASGAALFLIGAGTTLFTGRSVSFSGARQLLVGFAAAGVTYGLGKLIGAAVTG
jgi:VIT1/CCC1 family predicted Fe2+/Mn2+ transporter